MLFEKLEIRNTYLLAPHKPSLGKESIKCLNGLISPEMQINVCPQSRPNYRNFHTFFGWKIVLAPPSVSAFNKGWNNLDTWHLPRFLYSFCIYWKLMIMIIKPKILILRFDVKSLAVILLVKTEQSFYFELFLSELKIKFFKGNLKHYLIIYRKVEDVYSQ